MASSASMSNLAYEMYVCPSPNNMMKILVQPKLFVALAIAAPCGISGAALKWYQMNIDETFGKTVINDPAAYNTLSLLVVFILAFRVDCSYLKFWAGCNYVYNIGGSLFDGCADCFAYSRGSEADPKVVAEFHHLLIRLCSLLHAVICADLETGTGRFEEAETGMVAKSYSLELLDAGSIDEDSIKQLCMVENKVEYCFQWIQNACVEAHNAKVFKAEAPVVSRAFEDIGDSLVSFHEGQKITEVPFPFPYMISLQVLLITHYCLTPVVIAKWSNYWAWVGGFCFVGPFSIWLFIGLAIEMDLPFNYTKNSLSMQYMQRMLNYRLLTLLDTYAEKTPTLVNAKKNVNRRSMSVDAEVAQGLAQIAQRGTQRNKTLRMITGEA
mmetsp:Transcript_77521/g.136739  ORF Transcript_77521/g.136739 Transcript_77521/m.136739 type:complete len:382 (-) Transcript_77521:107-1252(-)|eukprot:CAMPEP_0197657072 /NCGR_PEP_ID=MMETSP1338-20131121/44406_1 /TAXON_ID=43686 ORGANISM="Pelagodinium beii, Strain RCC1491" /NCGR_SAMPLE_ID=MMETSP1338 /ASSEMBLY_ACC=CAM_ASM_000754 /LENGTH=381 /DNA_ID=CAMNT_0043233367 /DNA_START=116 /DNA_END=1261 /DNA_ORIENTATION=-